MFLTKYLNWYALLAGFGVGIFAVCFMRAETRKIYIYPTPENVDILQYQDQAGVCYAYSAKTAPCSTGVEGSKPATVKPQA